MSATKRENIGPVRLHEKATEEEDTQNHYDRDYDNFDQRHDGPSMSLGLN